MQAEIVLESGVSRCLQTKMLHAAVQRLISSRKLEAAFQPSREFDRCLHAGAFAPIAHTNVAPWMRHSGIEPRKASKVRRDQHADKARSIWTYACNECEQIVVRMG